MCRLFLEGWGSSKSFPIFTILCHWPKNSLYVFIFTNIEISKAILLLLICFNYIVIRGCVLLATDSLKLYFILIASIQIHCHRVLSHLAFQILPQWERWFQTYQYICLFVLSWNYTQNSFRIITLVALLTTILLSKFKIFCSSFCPQDVFNSVRLYCFQKLLESIIFSVVFCYWFDIPLNQFVSVFNFNFIPF